MDVLVLHSVSDARDCVERRLHQGRFIVSTHPAVDVYLKEEHGLESHCLTEYLSIDEVRKIADSSAASVDQILSALDSLFAAGLSARIGVQMKFFSPLFGYLGKYHHSAYQFFVESLNKVHEKTGRGKIFVYNRPFTSFLHTSTDMASFASKILGSAGIEIIEPENWGNDSLSSLKAKAGKVLSPAIFGVLGRAYRRFRTRLQLAKFVPGRKTILLHGDLYHLGFLPERLGSYNVLFYEQAGGSPAGVGSVPLSPEVSLPEAALPGAGSAVGEVFQNDVLEDFRRHIARYADAIAALKAFSERRPISFGIWGSPPVDRTKALIFEYLRAKGIKVAGSQHGSVYGEMHKPWHFDSDFNRCDYFLSCGFTRDDLKRLYPERSPAAEIVPVGSTRSPGRRSCRKGTYDILFPLSPVRSIFDGWHTNGPAHIFADRQVRLLKFLSGLSNLKVCVKPLPGSYETNCPALPLLRKLNGIEIAWNIPLTEFLDQNHVRAVLIEAPSTPLHEALALDAEIFLMNDFLQSFEAEALSALRKRVHYAEEVEEMCSLLAAFFKEKLDPKRDQTFYNHYVFKPDAQQRILSNIEKWIQQAPTL